MKKIIAICAAAAAALSFTGCSAEEIAEKAKKTANDTRETFNIAKETANEIMKTPEEKPEKLIIVSGNHGNAYQPDWTLIEDSISEACSRNAEIQLIIDDGKPFVNSINLEKIDTSLSKNNFNNKVKENTAKVIASCMTTTAQTEEVDVFEALNLAERCIDLNTSNEIIIIDSLLSTTGKINFTEAPLFSLDIENSAKSFENTLPNFENVNVTVYGLGEVSGEQSVLSSDDYNTLCCFWFDFFTTVGCDIRIDRTPYSNRKEPDSSLPNVTACPVTEDSSEISELKDNTFYELPPETLSFQPDTADFTDRDSAKEKLSDFAEKLNDTDSIVLVGMTASVGDAESSRTLSLQRAEAVRGLLQESEVKSNITCTGKGFDANPLHTPDLNADGTLNETAAVRNRTVLAMTEKTARKYGLI